MKDILLCETAQAAKTADGRWRAVLAVPGQGSSGFYGAEMLKQYGPLAFPAGTKAYINHDWKRDPRDILGHYPEGAYWDPEEGANGALVAELHVLPRHQELVDEVAPLAGLSIYAMGRMDEAGNITELVYHRTNSVDLVSEEGLEGSGLADKLSERALALFENHRRTAASADEREKDMTPEQIEEAAEKAVAKVLAPVLAFVSDQKQAAEAAAAAAGDEPKAPTVKEAVQAFAAASKAIKDAELLPAQEAALLARAEEGADITADLAEAVKIKDEAIAHVTEAARPAASGRRFDAGADNDSYSLGLRF
ncbi:hypothetical protein [Leifsonia aquatica]|uniref:hypothetical protein n=1 Tax=Leifsonia aquatica TaxID=144185 RepID=UPI000469032F|nr:hypothetical protein [Leifsonia aquatica]